MKNYDWSKSAAHWKKGYRISFWCAFALIFSLITLVFIAQLSGQPVNQRSLAEDFAPLIILFAGAAAICQIGHSWAKEKKD